MKSNRIIIVFIGLVIAIFSGYFIYSHNQKISLAQYYYDTGDYKKASDLNVKDISDKARLLNLAKNWGNDLNKKEDLYITIMLVSSEIQINKGKDSTYADKLEVYYKNIADYLNISTSRLDEIGKMNSKEGTIALNNIK